MDIDRGNQPPICQKPYTLVLKHYEWVDKEVVQLERAGVITWSVSPFGQPNSDSTEKNWQWVNFPEG